MQSILNIKLSECAWLQDTLPVKRGGLGVSLASQVALPAFLASSCSTFELVQKLLPSHLISLPDHQFDTAADIWKVRSGQSPSPHLAGSQKAWDMPLLEVTSEQVLSAAYNQAGIACLMMLPGMKNLLTNSAQHLIRSQHLIPGPFSRHCPVLLSAHGELTLLCASQWH